MKEAVEKNGWPEKLEVGLIGSCTNSSYEDISRRFYCQTDAVSKGLKTKSNLLLLRVQNRFDLQLKEMVF